MLHVEIGMWLPAIIVYSAFFHILSRTIVSRRAPIYSEILVLPKWSEIIEFPRNAG